MPETYTMNPKTDTLKYGEELRDGDKVLPEWELFRDDGRADEFYTVTRLDTTSEPKLVRFIALYDDGYMHPARTVITEVTP